MDLKNMKNSYLLLNFSVSFMQFSEQDFRLN